MSFLRHDEIYRSDVGGKTILSLKPSRASRWSAPTQNKGRGSDPAPFPSSAMSLGSAIPWRVALQQSPPPLYRPESILQPPAETVNHHLTGAEEFSTGDLGNFQPALTPWLIPRIGLADSLDRQSAIRGFPSRRPLIAVWNQT